MALPLNVRRYGSDAPLPEQKPLRAGPLSLVFEAGCLRTIRLGEHELLRRVYVAIRDRNWGTAPDEISNLQIDASDDSFHITYDVRNRLGDVDFAWHGEITGDAGRHDPLQHGRRGAAPTSCAPASASACCRP